MFFAFPQSKRVGREDSHKQAGKGPGALRHYFAGSELAQCLTHQALVRQAREMTDTCRNRQADRQFMLSSELLHVAVLKFDLAVSRN